jgi:hypothetical protein
MRKIVMVVVGVGAFAAAIALALMDCGPQDDWDLAGSVLVYEVIPDEDNVYVGFVAATNAVKEWMETGEFSKVKPERKAALVAANSEAIALFREAAHRAYWLDCSCSENWRNGLCLFSVGAFAKMIHLMRWETESKIENGQLGSAMDNVRALAALSGTMQSRAESVLCWLCACRAKCLALDFARSIALSPKATDGTLTELRRMVHSLSDEKRNRQNLYDLVGREAFYTFGGAQLVLERELAGKKSTIVSLYSYQPNRIKRIYNEIAVHARTLLTNDYSKVDWAEFNDEVDGLLSNSYIPNGAGRTLLAAVVPAWENVAKAVATDCFSCRATEIVVAAELYRRRNGKRPFSLSELVPAFLDSIPADPYKPDSPLSYDALCGIIWTVGADGDFNGDKEPEKNSYGRNRRYVIYLDGTKAQ